MSEKAFASRPNLARFSKEFQLLASKETPGWKSFLSLSLPTRGIRLRSSSDSLMVLPGSFPSARVADGKEASSFYKPGKSLPAAIGWWGAFWLPLTSFSNLSRLPSRR